MLSHLSSSHICKIITEQFCLGIKSVSNSYTSYLQMRKGKNVSLTSMQLYQNMFSVFLKILLCNVFSNSTTLTLVGNCEEDNLSLLINSAGTLNFKIVRESKIHRETSKVSWTLHHRIIWGYLRIKSPKRYLIFLLGLHSLHYYFFFKHKPQPITEDQSVIVTLYSHSRHNWERYYIRGKASSKD